VLTQDIAEKELFSSLHKYLGAGYITKNKNCVSLYITSLSELKNILFPILEEHPLKYGKLRAYLIFKDIVEAMLNKTHLNLEGLIKIIYTSFNLNTETGRRTEESKENLLTFLESKHGKLPTKEEIGTYSPPISFAFKSKMSLEFIAGLIDGDGSFNISFQLKPYRRVRVNFTVVQETSCKLLLHELKEFFSCGAVYDLPSAASRFQVENVDFMLNNIRPVLDKIELNTYKGDCYKVAIKVCEIIKTKGYKNDDALKEIVELAYDSNKLGKRRLITKKEFLSKISDT
jgi:hypothetical protein